MAADEAILFDQRTVETAAISFPLRVAPEEFWDPLADEAKHNLGTWQNGAINHRVPDCNWHFFKVLASLGPDRVGYPYGRDQAAMFAPHCKHWFDDEGSALPFGRSLTYRFALAGTISAPDVKGPERRRDAAITVIVGMRPFSKTSTNTRTRKFLRGK